MLQYIRAYSYMSKKTYYKFLVMFDFRSTCMHVFLEIIFLLKRLCCIYCCQAVEFRINYILAFNLLDR